ncbi:HLA class I histocompatibility antigen, B-37 alpha chain, partial [Galemys pyrenaicus]
HQDSNAQPTLGAGDEAPNSPLLLWGALALAETWAGLREPCIISVSYMKDTHFGLTVALQVKGQNPPPPPRAPWLEQVGQEDQEEETLNQQLTTQRLNSLLKDLHGYYNCREDSEQWSHTIQRTLGCDVGPGRCLLRRYDQFIYDGANSMALKDDLRSWTR